MIKKRWPRVACSSNLAAAGNGKKSAIPEPHSGQENMNMPRRPRPPEARRSEHWLRVMIHEYSHLLDKAIADAFGWNDTVIDWRSPRQDDEYAEYYDEAFLDRLGVDELTMPLDEFWPKSGPRWDGLARATDGKLILVEAKAHIDEVVDYRSKASPDALRRIEERLDEAKSAFRATKDACWHMPFYQMANRLAHLYYLAGINGKDAYLVFIDFANAPDVPEPASFKEWRGAVRLAHKCLGLKDSRLARRVTTIIVDLKNGNGQPSAGAYTLPRAAQPQRSAKKVEMTINSSDLEVFWEGPFSWPGFEEENGLPGIPYNPGVYLQTFDYLDGYLIYAAGITRRPVPIRFREHTRSYMNGEYNVLDPFEVQRGGRKEIWHGWGYARAHRNLFEERKSKIQQAVKKQLAMFRIFVADIGIQSRRLHERIEAAIMNHLYQLPSPFCDIPDQGMMLAPRWRVEEPILMKSRSTVKIHGIQEFLEV